MSKKLIFDLSVYDNFIEIEKTKPVYKNPTVGLLEKIKSRGIVYDTDDGIIERADKFLLEGEHIGQYDEVLDFVMKFTKDVYVTSAIIQKNISEQSFDEVTKSHNELVRELDVIINGKDAAVQASLCDLVSQLRDEYKNQDQKTTELLIWLTENGYLILNHIEPQYIIDYFKEYKQAK